MANPAMFQEWMFRNVATPDTFGRAADAEQERGWDLMRKMANMPDIPLPEPSQPKIDLKTAAIGSILAGILGNAEGAGSFLNGLIQGNAYKAQQADQAAQRRFQQQKLAQDRELGIMQTEATIANQKANQMLGRQDRMLRTQAANQSRLDKIEADKNNFLERLATTRFNSKAELQKMLGFAKQRGIEVPPDLEMQLNEAIKQQEASKQLAPMMRDLYATVKNQSVDPQTRAWNAAMLVNGLKSDPNLATLLGAHPLEVERLIKEINDDAHRATLANKTGLYRVQNLIKDGRLKDANLRLDNVNILMKGIEAKYADQKFDLENKKKAQDIAESVQRIKKSKADIALDVKKFKQSLKEGGYTGRKLLTANQYLSSWQKAANDVADADAEIDKANASLEYWQSIKQRKQSGEFSTVTDDDIEQSIMFYNTQRNLGETRKQKAQADMQSTLEQIKVLDEQSLPNLSPNPSARAKSLREKYGY